MLFNLTNSLRSLTASPAATAIDQARRMARRRLEAGGKAVPEPGSLADDNNAADFLLPPDIDPAEVVMAIEAKLRGGRGAIAGLADDRLQLERRLGGRVAVRGYHILRLGDGRFDLGRAFMHGIINHIRARRRMRSAQRR